MIIFFYYHNNHTLLSPTTTARDLLLAPSTHVLVLPKCSLRLLAVTAGDAFLIGCSPLGDALCARIEKLGNWATNLKCLNVFVIFCELGRHSKDSKSVWILLLRHLRAKIFAFEVWVMNDFLETYKIWLNSTRDLVKSAFWSNIEIYATRSIYKINS